MWRHARRNLWPTIKMLKCSRMASANLWAAARCGENGNMQMPISLYALVIMWVTASLETKTLD
jgi:hypothetical protein